MTYTAADSCQLDTLVDLLTQHIGFKTDGAFVEVGAFDGKNWSNTWTLAELGWRGLMVEPQPEYAQACRLNHARHPGVIVEQVACGAEGGRGALYLGGSLTTLRPEMVDVYNSLDWAKFSGLRHDKTIDVEVATLDALLHRHDWPPRFDLLVVDVEGAEMDVLMGFNLCYWQPTMAIVETHEMYPDTRLSGKAGPIGEYFAKGGYRKVHSDQINSVYVHDRG